MKPEELAKYPTDVLEAVYKHKISSMSKGEQVIMKILKKKK